MDFREEPVAKSFIFRRCNQQQLCETGERCNVLCQQVAASEKRRGGREKERGLRLHKNTYVCEKVSYYLMPTS